MVANSRVGMGAYTKRWQDGHHLLLNGLWGRGGRNVFHSTISRTDTRLYKSKLLTFEFAKKDEHCEVVKCDPMWEKFLFDSEKIWHFMCENICSTQHYKRFNNSAYHWWNTFWYNIEITAFIRYTHAKGRVLLVARLSSKPQNFHFGRNNLVSVFSFCAYRV